MAVRTMMNFYERDLYMLSNFSSFRLMWDGIDFMTSEVAYHWEKHKWNPEVQRYILDARSSHDAFKISQRYEARPGWNDWQDNGRPMKVNLMKELLTAKVRQHEYIRRKLIGSYPNQLSEQSWRDDFWGAGKEGDGQDWMGKLWMEIREGLMS